MTAELQIADVDDGSQVLQTFRHDDYSSASLSEVREVYRLVTFGSQPLGMRIEGPAGDVDTQWCGRAR